MFEIEDVTPPAPPAVNDSAPAPAPKPLNRVETRLGTPIEPRRIAWQVRSRWRWVLIGTALGAVLGPIFAIFFAPREYAVISLLTWDANALKADGRDPMRELHTLVDQVKTPAVLAEVRSRLALTTSLESLGQQIEVASDERSSLITLTTTSGTAKDAYSLAQTTLDVFQKQRLISEKKQHEEASASLASRLAAANQVLNELREQNQAFLHAEQVTDLKAELNQATLDAVHYSQDQLAASEDAKSADSRVASLKEAILHRSATVVTSEKVVRPNGAKLADIETELTGLRAGGLSEEHPRIKMLEAQARALRARGGESWANSVVTERNTGRNPEVENYQNRLIDAEAAREAALGREKMMGDLAVAAAAHVDHLRTVERRGGDLSRSLAAAETHVAELDAAHFQATESARAPVTGVSLLEAPALPSTPRSSKRRTYALAAVLLGTVLGALAVLFWTMRGLRVHTSSELAFWGNGPVLTSSQWPKRPVQPDLQEELHGQFRDGPPGVLIVPMGDRELTLLKELALVAHWPNDETGRAEDAPVRAWLDKPTGHDLRKAVKSATRVLVMCCAGENSLLKISEFPMRIGASPESLGYVLLDVSDELAVLPESIGDIRAFWRMPGESPRLRVVSSFGR